MTTQRLLLRQARELAGDVASAVRGRGLRDGLALSLVMARYHTAVVFGRNRRGRVRSLLLHVDGRTVRCAYRTDLSDMFVLREIFVQQIYRFPYERHIGTVKRVLDLGSNIGLSPLYFALCFPRAEIACVEPVPENLAMIRKNRDGNRSGWTIESAAIAARAGEVVLYSSGWWASSSTTQTVVQARNSQPHRPESALGGVATTVRAVSVNGLLERLQWATVDVLKMDIEGAEEDVLLNGDTSWLDRVGILVLDIHSKYVARERITNRLKEYGFVPAAESGPHSAVFLSARVRDLRTIPAARTP